MKKIIAVLFAFCLLLTNCGEDNDDNVTITTPEASVGFRLSHNFDEMSVTNSNYTTLNLNNANGEILTIERLRYQISKVELINSEGVIYKMNDYHLLDLSNPETFSFDGDTQIPFGNYTLNFIWGFNEEDNIDGAYPDLNSASWNWPVMLGGGYHFLQFDGKYNVNTASPSPFNFHNGTARISPDNFEQNFVSFNFSQTIEINSDTNIELNMDISELFKNPNTWDLNVLDTSLMPNYNAQKMMQANIETVFTIGDIITN